MKRVLKAKYRHLECSDGKVCRKAKERTVPFLVCNVDLIKQEQCTDHHKSQAVMQKSRDRRKIKYRGTLIEEGWIEYSDQSSDESDRPYKMINGIVFLSKENGECRNKACHSAEAVGDDLLPSHSIVSENLGKSIDHDPNKQCGSDRL